MSKLRPALKPGSYINEWHILEDDRRGRVGRVFIVYRDSEPNRHLALKLLREDRIASDPRTLQEEARRLRNADAPDCMPRFVADGTWEGLPYFVMELVEDVDYPIAPHDYRAYCVEACNALAALHAADIIHCDITALHLVRKNGRLAFIDFDNAHTHLEAAENTTKCIGTEPYIAPEVASQARLSEQSDIFSLARVLFDHCPKDLKPCFEPVLEEAMNINPKNRPRSAAELAERLRTCRTPHRRFRAVCRVAGGVAAVFVVSMVGYNVFRYRSAEIRYQQRVDAETAINKAMECMRRKDFDRVDEILTPIAQGGYARSEQAKRILEDARRLKARR